MNRPTSHQCDDIGVAIIGMAGRFPGASSLAEFWSNIRAGKESVSLLSDEELRQSGISDGILSRPDFVKAGAFLAGVDQFDAEFFNYSPLEAECMDPQHRIFLECAVEALEDAGCDPHRYPGSIGVFAGAAVSTYQLKIAASQGLASASNPLRTILVQGTDKDYLATRVSYKLNLSGPSLTIQTACSTSLVAVHVACQSLLTNECDLALAGGVSVTQGPRRAGYFFVEGGITSPDGHCRPFDADANGTVFGDGAGIVVLKRLDEALKANDRIYAVVRGSAVNNDGSAKIGYTAPSVDGQAGVVSEALSVAGISAATIQYIEAHGTGTSLGDPTEISALEQVFREPSRARRSCAIGSIKSNIGHLNTAAGVVGLMKTALALHSRRLPPSINFSRPNPRIDFDDSPFYVNREEAEWPRGESPRRAGVSSFGIGGTNAHAVLEEAVAQPPSAPSRKHKLLLLSARTRSALEAGTTNLVEYLRGHPDVNLADVCFTLSTGRTFYPHRRAISCRDIGDVVAATDIIRSDAVVTGEVDAFHRPVVFMFPGQGSQYIDMGRELYEQFHPFRFHFDACAEIAKPHLGRDLREIVFAPRSDANADGTLRQTEFAQPAIFSVSYAMAKLWEHWGVRPSSMIGHSIGEFVAACLADVFSLENALALVVTRGKLMQSRPPGSMLAVPLASADLETLIGPAVSVAAENGPALSVLSGSNEAIDEIERRLLARNIPGRRLRTSHAFHSGMMDPIVEPFLEAVAASAPKPPQIPYISNVTGTWIKSAEATSPAYWARHLIAPVKFWAGFTALAEREGGIFVEVGPGSTLTDMLQGAVKNNQKVSVFSSIRRPNDTTDENQQIAHAVAQLWTAGVSIEWPSFFSGERRNRVPLPHYPFERRRYWFDARETGHGDARLPAVTAEHLFHVPHWACIGARGDVPSADQDSENTCLIFTDEHAVGPRLVAALRDRGYVPIVVERGPEFTAFESRYRLSPDCLDHFRQLMKDLTRRGSLPRRVLYLWPLMTPVGLPNADRARENLALSFFGPTNLGQAIGERESAAPISILFVTDGAHQVIGDDQRRPLDAAIFGPTRVISREYKNLFCRHVDIDTSDLSRSGRDGLTDDLLFEAFSRTAHVATAYRRGRRWQRACASVRLDANRDHSGPFRQDGVYMITGGLGDLGLEIAKVLFEKWQAKLVLLGRTPLPERSQWPQLRDARGDSDPVVRRIIGVEQLEARGAEVMVIEADVADLVQMKSAVSRARARFGVINGVVHAAGIAGADLIGMATTETLQDVLAPKVTGTLVIDEVFSDQPLEILILFSSVTSLTGGLGQVAYAAGNAVLDAYAERGELPSARRTISINWDAWREIGMAVRPELPKTFRNDREAWLRGGLPTGEALEAFQRVAASAFPQVIISKRSMADVFAPREIDVAEPAARAGRSSPALQPAAPQLHPRPALRQDYVAPSTAAEHVVAEIWQESLRIDQVGVHDDFFELGGHSLLALQMLPHLYAKFQVQLSPRDIWACPTVAGIALLIEEKLISELENGAAEAAEAPHAA
jgi:acyl transferase domain-containing protein/acyl carrier protein